MKVRKILDTTGPSRPPGSVFPRFKATWPILLSSPPGQEPVPESPRFLRSLRYVSTGSSAALA